MYVEIPSWLSALQSIFDLKSAQIVVSMQAFLEHGIPDSPHKVVALMGKVGKLLLSLACPDKCRRKVERICMPISSSWVVCSDGLLVLAAVSNQFQGTQDIYLFLHLYVGSHQCWRPPSQCAGH